MFLCEGHGRAAWQQSLIARRRDAATNSEQAKLTLILLLKNNILNFTVFFISCPLYKIVCMIYVSLLVVV